MRRARPHPSTPQLERALERAADALEDGEPEAALAAADEALAIDPRSAQALQLRGAALAEQDLLDEAEEALERAVAAAPDDPEVLFGAADLLISLQGEERDCVARGLEHCARGRKLAKKRGDDELFFELTLLEGIGLNQVGDCAKALVRLDEALALDPDSVDARLERAIALFELCRFDEAKPELERVLALADGEEPWAHHYLGLLAERRGDLKEAKRRFARATELAPEDFPPPVQLSEREFDQAVEDAVARLPEHVKKYLENTTISVEPIPADDDLTSSAPALSPCILGVFRGTPVGERSVTDARDHFPAAIVLYQRNLERFARSREELIEQIGITLMHEVGHLIGLDEEDLWERGLD